MIETGWQAGNKHRQIGERTKRKFLSIDEKYRCLKKINETSKILHWKRGRAGKKGSMVINGLRNSEVRLSAVCSMLVSAILIRFNSVFSIGFYRIKNYDFPMNNLNIVEVNYSVN